MADISKELADILSAIYGEDVRGSIHDAIALINAVSEKMIVTGTEVTDTTSSIAGFYKDSLYYNNETCDLWRCNGISWDLESNLVGNGIISIHLASSVGLTDTYTITYKDGTTSNFTVKNGKGIKSVAKTGTNKLIDTYTITFNDNSTYAYSITNGENGNKWFRGTEINGKQTNPTVFATSGIDYAHENDYYLNPSEGAIYYCVLSGDASTALWVFDFTLAGGGAGVSTWGDLSNKPFNYVGKSGLEITGSTPNDYTLNVKVDGSYVKTDSNGALTINPSILSGVYSYSTTDFRTDDVAQIVYLSTDVQTKLSKTAKINADGTIAETALATALATKINGKISSPSTKTDGQVLTYNGSSGEWEAKSVEKDHWFGTAQTTTGTSVTFNNIDPTKAYDLYAEDKLVSITSLTVTGTSITYEISGASAGDTLRLREIV